MLRFPRLLLIAWLFAVLAAARALPKTGIHRGWSK